MTILRLLNPQGIAGLAAATILALLLIAAKIDTRHFRKQSAQFEQLYRLEAKAHADTVANFRIATERARAADRANVERVRTAQAGINERTSNDLQARLADARARAQRLRISTEARSDSGRGGSPPVSGLSASSGVLAQSAPQDRLPRASHEVATSWGLHDPDRLIATEQAIQLDELIKWVRSQAAVDPNAPASE